LEDQDENDLDKSVSFLKGRIDADIVDCIVTLPNQLFYSTQIPACLWFLTKDKNNKKWRNRTGEILFIHAKSLGVMANRTRREFTAEDIAKIATTYHAWRGETGNERYEDVAGYCASVKLADIEKNGYVLTAGRYVGAEDVEDNDEDFATKMQELTAKLATQMTEGAELDMLIRKNLQGLGYEL
jgi:type I restriction enzyme M protein